MHRPILTLVLLALLAAVPATADRVCKKLKVRDSSSNSAAGAIDDVTTGAGELPAGGSQDTEADARRKRFSATQVLDLEFRLRLRRNTAGDHVLRLKLLTPKGHHYQTLTVPFAVDAAQGRGATRRIEGYPRPLPVRLAEPETDAAGTWPTVSANLPVGGTAIVSSSLYGRWAAEAYLDDDTTACKSVRFFLDP